MNSNRPVLSYTPDNDNNNSFNKQTLSGVKRFGDILIQVSLAGDALMIAIGLVLGYLVRYKSGLIPFFGEQAGSNVPPMASYIGVYSVGLSLLLLTFSSLGLYERSIMLRLRRITSIITKGLTIWFFIYIAFSFSLKFEPPISRIFVGISTAFCGVLLFVWRYLLSQIVHSKNIADKLRQRVLFVGWSKEAEKMYWEILKDSSHPYEVVGCIAPTEGTFSKKPPEGLQQFKNHKLISEILENRFVDIIVMSDLEARTESILELASSCEREYVQFKLIPSYFQILISGLHLETISGVPILGVSRLPLDSIWNRMLKRTMDICGALFGIIMSMPIMAFCSALIYLESPGSVIYRQVRSGREGNPFEILKLRSMKLNAEAPGKVGWTQENDPRRLRIGKYLREWNLDELPQFYNVLKGDMSLVGPRPERPELISKFKVEIPHYNARHSAKTGMTGWAQVHGLRGDTDLSERIQYDLYYLENWSIWLDLQIIFMTLFTRKNAY